MSDWKARCALEGEALPQEWDEIICCKAWWGPEEVAESLAECAYSEWWWECSDASLLVEVEGEDGTKTRWLVTMEAVPSFDAREQKQPVVGG